jgi:hypothetical protein
MRQRSCKVQVCTGSSAGRPRPSSASPTPCHEGKGSRRARLECRHSRTLYRRPAKRCGGHKHERAAASRRTRARRSHRLSRTLGLVQALTQPISAKSCADAVSINQDKTGTDESIRVARDWSGTALACGRARNSCANDRGNSRLTAGHVSQNSPSAAASHKRPAAAKENAESKLTRTCREKRSSRETELPEASVSAPEISVPRNTRCVAPGVGIMVTPGRVMNSLSRLFGSDPRH